MVAARSPHCLAAVEGPWPVQHRFMVSTRWGLGRADIDLRDGDRLAGPNCGPSASLAVGIGQDGGSDEVVLFRTCRPARRMR